MNSELVNTIIMAFAFIILFGLAELLYHVFRVKAELTRKLVHFGTGSLTLFFPILINNLFFVSLLALSFVLILYLSKKYQMLKSINAIDRPSHGSLSYPFAVLLCYGVYVNCANYINSKSNPLILFYLPILILAISDPLAALIGRRWPKGKFKIGDETKTLLGSSAFFISACCISIFIVTIFLNSNISNTFNLVFSCILISLIASISEALSRKGLDNLFIPSSVIITTLFCFQYIIL